MSAVNFYLEKGFTPRYRFTMRHLAGTAAVWTPTTSTRLVLTGLTVTNNNAAGTIEFTWGNLNINDRRVMMLEVGASATVSPRIMCIESTMYDRALFANASVDASYGWAITAEGFEIPAA